MSLNISLHEQPDLKPSLCVFGVGGAGGNAVNNMIVSQLDGVDFWVTNTDAQSLNNAATGNRVQLGAKSTKGLGAGSHPEIGKLAAEESTDELKAVLQNYNMVFITAGMGGGTGTGAAPVIAKIAKELNILTVGVVTKPFHFEGARRMKMAELGLEEMQKYVDTLIVIPNQNLFRVANEKTTFADAFRTADDVLHSGVRGITDLITMPGLINLDFADIRTVVGEMGKAMMGTGEADGENRAIRAAESAISNPLLDNSSMKGAKAVLINITGGTDMTLYEVDEAANRIKEEAPEAIIIFGSAFNSDLEGKLRVSVVATGIDGNAFGQHANSINAAPRTTEAARASEAISADINLSTTNASSSNDENSHFEDILENVAVSLEVNKKLNESFIPPQAIDPEMSKDLTNEENLAPDHDAAEQNNLSKNIAEAVPNVGLFGRVAASFRGTKPSLDEPTPVNKNDELFDVPAFMRRKINDK